MQTNNRLLSGLKKYYYPPQEIQLLQKAELAPLPEARQAWGQWRDLDRLNDISWQEQKILARMHSRIRELDPDYLHLPRIVGFLKSEWTRSQFLLKESMAAVDLLLAHGYKLMLFKGIAWDKQHQAKGIRLSGDLDILVPEKDFVPALTLLEQNNWESEADTHWLKTGIVPDDVHGIGYKHAQGGNIDIHRRPAHAIPSAHYLDGLWERSQPGTFMDRPVNYCSHADYLTLLIAHGVGKNAGEFISSLWPGDLHQSVASFDTDSMADFRAIIYQLRIPLECEFALAYCKDVLQSDKVAEFAAKVEPFKLSVPALIRSILNSPPAFTQGALLWFVAGSLRRLSRFANTVRNSIKSSAVKQTG